MLLAVMAIHVKGHQDTHHPKQHQLTLTECLNIDWWPCSFPSSTLWQSKYLHKPRNSSQAILVTCFTGGPFPIHLPRHHILHTYKTNSNGLLISRLLSIDSWCTFHCTILVTRVQDNSHIYTWLVPPSRLPPCPECLQTPSLPLLLRAEWDSPALPSMPSSHLYCGMGGNAPPSEKTFSSMTFHPLTTTFSHMASNMADM